MRRNAQTRDVGLAIRDLLESQNIVIYADIEGELVERRRIRVEFVDCSDPDNLVFHLENDQQFIVRVIAG